jgi:hypothetical protein
MSGTAGWSPQEDIWINIRWREPDRALKKWLSVGKKLKKDRVLVIAAKAAIQGFLELRTPTGGASLKLQDIPRNMDSG